MQVFSFYLLFGHNVDTVEHPQLWNMVKYLDPEVFLVLNRVKAHIKFREHLKILDVAQLEDLMNAVKA